VKIKICGFVGRMATVVTPQYLVFLMVTEERFHDLFTILFLFKLNLIVTNEMSVGMFSFDITL
jgi:hypothetical protein